MHTVTVSEHGADSRKQWATCNDCSWTSGIKPRSAAVIQRLVAVHEETK